MEDMWVRGIFFYQVLDYVRKNKDKSTYDLMGKKQEDYRADKKYSFDEFAELLAKADMMVGNGEDGFITKMAMETMMEEASWKVLFRRMDPRSIFTTTQRQSGRHNIADYETLEEDKNHVKLSMRLWTKNAAYQVLWADFYRGRLMGILKLMGRKGEVRMEKGSEPGQYFYTVEWI